MSSSIRTGTLRLRQRRVGGDSDDAIIIRMKERLADRGAIDFKLGMRVALEPFDDHQIDRTEFLQNIAERRLGFVAQFVDDGPAPARDDRDLAGAGLPMQPGILARLVDVEFVVRMLDGRNLEPAPHQHRNHSR